MNRLIFISTFLYFFISSYLSAAQPYNRYLYGTWIDDDRDCQNTRHEVLIQESLIPVTYDKSKCKVIKGKWYDRYTDQYIYEAKYLDIDHLVPLKEVHKSGGYFWGPDKRKKYSNDLTKDYTLIAVHRKVNRSKGAKNITQWLPPNKAYQCKYVMHWKQIKEDWSLEITKEEQKIIKTICKAAIKPAYYLQQMR